VKSPGFIYLASGSPRRRELLQQIGIPFQVIQADLDETVAAGEKPFDYVSRLAAAKAEAGWLRCRDLPEAPVLAADTAVILDGRILGKPTDRDDAMKMLHLISGRTHEVLTAVALRTQPGTQVKVSRSSVTFRPIAAEEAIRYWDTGEPRDKAGAYAIQGYAAVFITDIKGSYSGVMGLPLFETAQLLESAGVPAWR
jgi:septum formation protein